MVNDRLPPSGYPRDFSVEMGEKWLMGRDYW